LLATNEELARKVAKHGRQIALLFEHVEKMLAPVPVKKNLSLTQVSVALFSSKEAHRCFVVYILRTIHDGNHFALGTNGLIGANALGNFFEVALLRIPVAPDFNPNLVVRYPTSFLAARLSLSNFCSTFARGYYVALPPTNSRCPGVVCVEGCRCPRV
jgi:hypothetical protein